MIAWWLMGCARYDVSAPTVPMADGTALAVDVILPEDRPEGGVPVVLVQTRYWRSFDLIFRRGPNALPIQPREDIAERLVAAGFGVVLADVRGTGASEGAWERPWSAEEVADAGALVDWIAEQPWSDGRIGATGVSYEGTTALLAAEHPGVRAVLAREVEWDLVDEILAPGGVKNVGFIEGWSAGVAQLDAGEIPDFFPQGSAWMIRGPRPVDADPERARLAEILAARTIANVAEDIAAVRLPSDPWGEGGPEAGSLGPSRHASALAGSSAAIGLWGGWWDAATADAVLRADEAISLVDARIGGWTHEGTESASPLGGGRDARVDLDEVVGFFAAHLARDGGPPVRRWYVAGLEAWEEGATWPTTHPQTWNVRGDGTLGEPDADLARALPVDFDAAVGTETRWTTGLLTRVDAPDRAGAPGLLSFSAAPLAAPLRVFGAGTFTCTVGLQQPEAAVHVYVEAVEPHGAVRLLTEGVVRASAGTVNVHLRPVAFALDPEWAVRLSVAGADAGTFERVPATGAQEITLSGADCALTMPVRS